jgi:hypothetical protein
MTDEVIIKDFSRKRPRILLALDGEEYEARSALGLPTLQRIQQVQKRIKDPEADKIAVFGEMFSVLLKAEAAERFTQKLKDEDNPVDPDQLQGMIAFIMERNGGRPTEESPASPDGSSDAVSGTPSTDGVSSIG